MPEPLIVTLGDVLALSLITPPEGLLVASAEPAETWLTVGGQAAVCACWVVAAGARGRAVSARSYDRLGDLVEAELADRGVELERASRAARALQPWCARPVRVAPRSPTAASARCWRTSCSGLNGSRTPTCCT